MNTRLFKVIAAAVLCPLVSTGQALQDTIPVKNWPAALFWQPSIQERRAGKSELPDSVNTAVNPDATTPVNSLVFVAMTPCRIADTRTNSGFSGPFGPGSLVGGASRTFPIQSQSSPCPIPSIAQAYSFNITIVPPGFLNFITVWPTGQPRPNASTLNGYVNTVIANAAIVPAGTSGSVDVYASENTNLIIDVNGYYAPQSGLTLSQGTASAPSLSFAGDPGTGIFSSQPGTLDIAVGGASALRVSNGETNISGAANVGGNFSINGSANIGGANVSGARLAVQGSSAAWPFNAGIYAIGGSQSGVGIVGSSETGIGIAAQSNGSVEALNVNNNHPSGIGIKSRTSSSDANLVIANGGAGPLIRGFCSVCGSPAFEVQNNGATIVKALGGTVAMRAEGNGQGLYNATLIADNTNPSGIGIWSHVQSIDASLVVSNDSTGDLIRAFCAYCSTPAFTVHNNGATLVSSNAVGINGAALRADNTNTNGIGIVTATNSTDGTLIIGNGGSGPLIRGFCNNCGNYPSFEVQNNGTTVTRVLQITGGSDLAEHFEVMEGAQPGMVVAVDRQNTGKLTLARGAYNRRAVGVISGANDLSAGMVLPDLNGSKDSKAVTLTGRVWVYCDATKHAIQAGDLLTTSDIPGHAMKVTNYGKAQGAIIGKALTGLKSGRGLVLVLASLQ